jgi:hypothetical protein
MAKKIIQEGAKSFVADCHHCGCQFSYELSDCYGSGWSKEVTCPQCGAHISHRSQRLPPKHTL